MSQHTSPLPPPGAAPPAGWTPQPRVRRLLAATVVFAPALLGINSLFHPEVEMSGAGIFAGAAADPSAWYVVHVIAALGALLGLPAAAGLCSLVRDRGRRLATTGLGLVMVGSPVLAMTFSAEASVLRLAAGLDPSAGLALAEAYAQTPEFYAVGAAVALSTLGSLLLGTALLASRTTPRWMAGGYLAGTVVSLVAMPGTLVGPIAFGVIALASVGLAAQVVRARPEYHLRVEPLAA
jgi:hypothetical protein